MNTIFKVLGGIALGIVVVIILLVWAVDDTFERATDQLFGNSPQEETQEGGGS